ncbi:MAG: hypothetical protein KBC53_03510 [Nitrosomonas sp.]|nr:hypothetical protein [Nitrosomonas sp.]
MFETATVEYRMNDKHHFLNYKEGVTPAEFQLLQLKHGLQSVIVKEFGDTIKDRTNDQEIERLTAWYKPKAMAAVFHGVNPRMPSTFQEIGIYLDNEQPEAKTIKKEKVQPEQKAG